MEDSDRGLTCERWNRKKIKRELPAVCTELKANCTKQLVCGKLSHYEAMLAHISKNETYSIMTQKKDTDRFSYAAVSFSTSRVYSLYHLGGWCTLSSANASQILFTRSRWHRTRRHGGAPMNALSLKCGKNGIGPFQPQEWSFVPPSAPQKSIVFSAVTMALSVFSTKSLSTLL